MPLHPEYEAFLKQLEEAGGPPLNEMPVEAAREMYRALQPEREDIAVGGVTDMQAGNVPVRVYTPQGDGPFPLVMMFHGGGWVIGDLVTCDGQSRVVCNGAGAVVVSVDYRLAPEHKYPAAAEDCYAATLWAAENAAGLNADASRLAVAGDSAGGNLAAVVSQMVRDRGGPDIAFQLLVYPATNGVDFNTESFFENGQDYFLTGDAMHWFWDHYAPDQESRSSPYASPIQAGDLSGLPPSLTLTAEFDPLRDEGEEYAKRMAAAGCDAKFVRYDGLIHGFFAQSEVFSAAKEPMEHAIEALKGALSA